jgi:glycosyltransferase involved in cell wall biosynthesis
MLINQPQEPQEKPAPNLISICIPTRNRPALLKLAIESCFAQRYRPIEILIGDSSDNEDTQSSLMNIDAPEGISIRHCLHSTPLKQSANVNWLFHNAWGNRLILLHDDDLLCKDAVDLLDQGWRERENTACVFGKQLIVSFEGHVLEAETEQQEQRYGRISSNAGCQSSNLDCGLRQQIPNNGFLVDSQLARQVRYRSEADVGLTAVDVDFGIRLGAETNRPFHFVNEYVSKYRLTPNSVLRARTTNRGQHLFFKSVEAMTVPSASERARRDCLRRFGAAAALDAAKAGDRWFTLKVICSPFYERPLVSGWTAIRLLYVLAPSLASTVERRLRP